MNKKIFFMAVITQLFLASMVFAGNDKPQDILDPGFYEERSIKDYIQKISNNVEDGVKLAEDFKTDLSGIKADQLELNKLSLGNSYKIEILSLKQGVINRRIEILEGQDKETRKLLTLLSQGVEKTLRFVNGVYGLFGFLAGVMGTVIGGVTVVYIKRYLTKRKRLDND